jgi:hypothetical protein
MASVASGLKVRAGAPGTTTSMVRHTPWSAVLDSAADGAALRPATIAMINAPHEIKIFECFVMETSWEAVSTALHRGSSATTRRSGHGA